ncbi:DUF2945 domain-containing protein [Erythrobacter sp. NFXS35]|uniref:DUF2945 domain-containing protein n=1 Tax=Erythrobacter sp. NFXS35 TaxID=2818436 RepID=UPI0032DF5962
MSEKFGKGQKVKWQWGSGEGRGKVVERFERDVTRTLKGSEITRHGSTDNPAYLIEQDDGDQVLKLGSELEADKG